MGKVKEISPPSASSVRGILPTQEAGEDDFAPFLIPMVAIKNNGYIYIPSFLQGT